MPGGEALESCQGVRGIKDFSGRANPSIHACRGRSALELAVAVAADSAGDSEFGRSFSSHAPKLGVAGEESFSMGPMAKLRRVAGSDCYVEQIAKFAQA